MPAIRSALRAMLEEHHVEGHHVYTMFAPRSSPFHDQRVGRAVKGGRNFCMVQNLIRLFTSVSPLRKSALVTVTKTGDDGHGDSVGLLEIGVEEQSVCKIGRQQVSAVEDCAVHDCILEARVAQVSMREIKARHIGVAHRDPADVAVLRCVAPQTLVRWSGSDSLPLKGAVGESKQVSRRASGSARSWGIKGSRPGQNLLPAGAQDLGPHKRGVVEVNPVQTALLHVSPACIHLHHPCVAVGTSVVHNNSRMCRGQSAPRQGQKRW